MEFGAFHPRQIPISDDCRAHKIELDDALDVLIILFQQSESHGAIRFTHSFTMTRAAAETCRLDFRAVFHLNVNVPPNGEVSSLTGIADHGPAAFRTTHWSVVLTAQDDSPAAHEALEKLCRTYWRPIYGFVRRQGVGPEEAEDLTQGFFALLLERRDLNTVRQEKGRLRSYLLVSLKHFLTNERYRAMAIKRGEGRRLVPLDVLGDS